MDELPGIECPTLIVAADREANGDSNAYEQMWRLIAHSELVCYDTAAHNICDACPERCVDDRLRFLEKHQRAHGGRYVSPWIVISTSSI